MEATVARKPDQINVLDSLVTEFAQNKAEADRLHQRNKQIANQLAELATYKPGCETGRIETDGYKVTVTKKINETWDQERLNAVRSTITDAAFMPLFRFKWEPKGREMKAFLNLPGSNEIKAEILSARTIKPGTPAVKLEAI